MPNLTTLFPPETAFGANAGQVSTWAQGNNTATIPASKLPNISIGNTFTFSTATAVQATALTEFYAEATNLYHQGDVAVITYDSGGTPLVVSLLYTGTNQTIAGATAATDWTILSTPAGGVTSLTGGTGINVNNSIGAVTVNNDLDIARGGTDVNAGFVSTVNFSSAFTVAANSSDDTQIDVGIASSTPGAYSVISTPAANTAINFTANSVQVIPGATTSVTHSLPSTPPIGTWVKVINLSGRSDTIIARNGQPIQGNSTDLVLNDSTANFELIYINTSTGWAIVGSN